MAAELRPPARFDTARLILRAPQLEDARPLYENHCADPEATRYISWRTHRDLSVTEDAVAMFRREWETNGRDRAFIIALRERPDQLIGTVGYRSKPPEIVLGYALGRRHWGRGYATEATRALLDWALAQPSIWRASAVCDVDNPASARVLERVGMRFEGRLRRAIFSPNVSDDPRDALQYARVRDDVAVGRAVGEVE